jgi:hypothetical protein
VIVESESMSCLACWKRCVAWFMEGCHKPVASRVESIQPFKLHEMNLCRRNLFALLQSYRLASIE